MRFATNEGTWDQECFSGGGVCLDFLVNLGNLILLFFSFSEVLTSSAAVELESVEYASSSIIRLEHEIVSGRGGACLFCLGWITGITGSSRLASEWEVLNIPEPCVSHKENSKYNDIFLKQILH